VLAVATAVVAVVTAVVAAILGFVMARSFGPEPPHPDDVVAHAPEQQPANMEEPEASVAEPVTASEPPAFSPPSEPEPARTAEPIDSQLRPPTMAVPITPTATQAVVPLGWGRSSWSSRPNPRRRR
jgi:hypothetical protein